MKHHLYQIYYGGWKIKLPQSYWCDDCATILYGYKKNIQHLEITTNDK